MNLTLSEGIALRGFFEEANKEKKIDQIMNHMMTNNLIMDSQ